MGVGVGSDTTAIAGQGTRKPVTKMGIFPRMLHSIVTRQIFMYISKSGVGFKFCGAGAEWCWF